MLQAALTSYKNGTIEAAQVIEELIAIAKKIEQEEARRESSDLLEDELLFYDALLANGSASEVIKDEQLRDLARVLVEQVRKDAGIDWQDRLRVQAKLRVNVKKTLKKYGYPPDQQAMATELVLEQAKSYGDVWSREKKRDSLGGASLVN